MVQGVEIEGGHIVNRNPADNSIIARVPVSTPTSIEGMIATAKAAQRDWISNYTISQRVGMLKAGCNSLKEDMDGLARLMTMEMGKVLSEARDEAEGAADKDEFLDLIGEANQPMQVGGEGAPQAVIVRDPMGVVVVLAPWNFPADEVRTSPDLAVTKPILRASKYPQLFSWNSTP